MFVNLDLQGSKASAFQHKVQSNFVATKSLTTSENQTLSKSITPLNAHKAYAQIGFAGTLASHKSWGAAVQLSGDVNFKLFTWPDAKKVFVEISDAIQPEKSFREGFIKVLKNATGMVTDIVADGNKSRLVELSNLGEGVFEKKAPSKIAKDGEKYRFIIVKANNEIAAVNDPYAMKQENIHGWSTIYDHNKFQWGDTDWMNGKVPERISRIHYKSPTPLSNPYNALISECNIATLTEKGDFESAKEVLDRIAKEKIFNAIEIMPVENTHSFNWGYDGVNKFAVSNFLGGPNQLKEFINHAHKNKLNVIMDIVPNHVGPDGNYLGITGPYLDGDGPFGSYLNFEKKNNKYVREYITNSALLWARDYHCDGIRADMTKFMNSDYTMKEIAAEVNYHNPHTFLIAEDGRENDWRVTRPLKPEEPTESALEAEHCKYIEEINKDRVDLNNLGFGSEWDFPFHHQIAAAILGRWDNHTRNLNALDAVIKSSPHRVKYFMSHDEIGNMDGTRLITKSVTNDLGMYNRVKGDSDSEKGQRAAQATQVLLKVLVTGDADKMSSLSWENFNNRNNIMHVVPLKELKEAYKKAFNRHKLSLGQTMLVPGPKMIFQGDESGKINPFKFFREFSSGADKEEYMLTNQKGYKAGKAAFLDSKMTSINYSHEYNKNLEQVNLFTKKLANIIRDNPALQEGKVQDTIVHNSSGVYGMHRKEGQNEIFTVSNFSDFGYDKNYYLALPRGKWQEVLNSDAGKFGGSDKFLNDSELESKGMSSKISLPGNSIIIFKKV